MSSRPHEEGVAPLPLDRLVEFHLDAVVRELDLAVPHLEQDDLPDPRGAGVHAAVERRPADLPRIEQAHDAVWSVT